jgi:hypothetical protein
MPNGPLKNCEAPCQAITNAAFHPMRVQVEDSFVVVVHIVLPAGVMIDSFPSGAGEGLSLTNNLPVS